jgi:hypothetical protein
MNEFLAAIGLSVLDDFHNVIHRRQIVAKRYAEVLCRSAKGGPRTVHYPSVPMRGSVGRTRVRDLAAVPPGARKKVNTY